MKRTPTGMDALIRMKRIRRLCKDIITHEEGHIYYINTDIPSHVRNIDIRNTNVWILGGCMTKEEFEARVHEIKEKAWQLGANQYADGFEKGYAEGARNQDEIQYKHGYEAGVVDGKKSIEALEAEKTSYNSGYNKGLEDLWEMWHWYLNNDLETIRIIFPEYKTGAVFMVMAKRVGLAESVRRIKEYMKADTGLLYSTISDLKADYTKEQIVKALKDNNIEVIEVVDHE